MTQLVELQQVLPGLRAAGYEPFAVSNDTVERLATFAERNHITFPLLSDEDSAVIRRYGILNTLIAPAEGKEMRWYGIPFPGTYVANAAGVIVQKAFHQHHARRASGATVLHQLTGIVPNSGETDVRAVAEGSEVVLEAYLIDGALRLEVLSTLVVNLRVAPGLHLYAPGAPEAFQSARLHIGGHGIRVGEATWPMPAHRQMVGVGADVPVWEGEVTVTLPVTATSELVRLGHGLDQPETTITVGLDFQACDADTCMLAQSVAIDLRAPLRELVEPDGLRTYVARLQG